MTHRSSAEFAGVIDRARELLPGMPEAQRTIAALILDDPAAVARMTIVELAERCRVSTGSITRLCRALGLSGYADLRIALAADSSRTGRDTWRSDIGEAVAENDDIPTVAGVLSQVVRRVVGETLDRLDAADVERAAAAVAAARRVEICGVGGSGVMAAELQQRLYRIGVPAWASSDVHIGLTGAALLGPRDVVVAISHNGHTRDVNDLVLEAASRGALTVGITDDPTSTLAQRAELLLVTSVGRTPLHAEAIVARHAQMAVLDLLYLAVAQRTFDQTTEAMDATLQAVRPYKDRPANPPDVP